MLVEGDATLQLLLALIAAYDFRRVHGVLNVGVTPVGLDEAVDGRFGQAAPVLEVATNDEVALGMGAQPGLAPTQQLLDLVVPDPVVFAVVQNRHEGTYRWVKAVCNRAVVRRVTLKYGLSPHEGKPSV